MDTPKDTYTNSERIKSTLGTLCDLITRLAETEKRHPKRKFRRALLSSACTHIREAESLLTEYEETYTMSTLWKAWAERALSKMDEAGVNDPEAEAAREALKEVARTGYEPYFPLKAYVIRERFE